MHAGALRLFIVAKLYHDLGPFSSVCNKVKKLCNVRVIVALVDHIVVAFSIASLDLHRVALILESGVLPQLSVFESAVQGLHAPGFHPKDEARIRRVSQHIAG